MRKTSVSVLAAALSALLVVLTAAPVSASTTTYLSRSNGTAAVADWQAPDGDITQDAFVQAEKTRLGTDVFVSLCDFNNVTLDVSCRAGFLSTTDNVFSYSRLDSATLAPVEIELYDDFGYGNPSGTVTVQANWTCSGKAQK